MEIHNVMEDIVGKAVDEMFDQEEHDKKLGRCTCFQCRLDVTCYVLNRIPPEYVISSRGAAHAENDFVDRIQKTADVVSLAREGWSKIDQTKRPHFKHSSSHERDAFPEGPVFNFPAIMGRVFNGVNFEPMAGIQIGLYSGSSLVKMIDLNWENPASLVASTSGTFIFLPFPEIANEEGITRKTEFSLISKNDGFEDLEHFLEVETVSESSVIHQFMYERVIKIPDLYIFPKG